MTTDTRLEHSFELIERDARRAIRNMAVLTERNRRMDEIIRKQREQMVEAAKIEERANIARSEHTRTLLKVRG